MNKKLCAAAMAAILAGCAGKNLGGIDTGAAVNAGMSMVQAATLSDAQVQSLSKDACAASDEKNKIAAADSKYSQRLAKIMAGLKDSGVQTNAKVYLTKDVNAWAMANGCVRVYSGLMDLMTDDEVRGVVGHEIGHVALGHTKSAAQVAFAASAARGALSATGGTMAALSSSQLGDLSEKFINAQFSQKQETAADDYSFDLLKKNKANLQALVTAFEKLAKLDGGKSGMLDSHPGSTERAAHLSARIKGQ